RIRERFGSSFTWLPWWGLLIAVLALGLAWLLLVWSLRSQPHVDVLPLSCNGAFTILALIFVWVFPDSARAIPLVVFAGVMAWPAGEFVKPRLQSAFQKLRRLKTLVPAGLGQAVAPRLESASQQLGRLETLLPASVSEAQRQRTLQQQRDDPRRF